MKSSIMSVLFHWIPTIVAWNLVGIAVLIVVINIALSIINILH